jgi:heme a synthase
LATHLGAALILYVGMLWTSLDLWFPKSKTLITSVDPKRVLAFKRGALGLSALVFTTAISGAFLAGLDGGVAYSMFPLMEEGRFKAENAWNLRILKDQFSNSLDWVKDNLFDNVAGVQFNHRVLALTSAGSISAMYYLTRNIASSLPRSVQLARMALLGVVAGQVTLGISTLLLLVPVHIASAHQAGSVALLSTSLWLLHSLCRIRIR